MNYCPLMSYAKQYAQEIPCLGEECAMAADGAGECLIKQALALYVGAARTKQAEEEERSRREMQQALAYWESLKEKNVRKVEPIQYAHQPIDAYHPHGGMYEDLSDLRDRADNAEVKLRPPRIENHSMNI